MARPIRVFALVVVALALAAIGTRAEEAVDLRLRLTPGQVLRYEVSGQCDLDVGMAGTKTTMKNTQTFSGTYQVVSVDENGNYRMRMTVERIAFSAHSPAMVNWPAKDIDYDSGKPEDKEKEKTLMGMLGSLLVAEEFAARVSPTGKVLESAGMEKIRKKLLAAFPKDADQIAKMTDSSASEKLWPVFCERPQEAKKPGESWPVEEVIGGVMRCNAKVKLDKVENGRALVVSAGLDITFGNFAKPKETPSPDAELAKNIKVTKSEMSGTTQINLATGALKSADWRMAVEYGMPDPYSGQAISYRMVNNMTAKLLPVRSAKPAKKK